MFATCVAIIIVVLISSFMCLRSGYKELSVLILPVSLVPLGHIIGSRILPLLKQLLPDMVEMSIITAIDVAALVVAAAVIVVGSKSFFKRSSLRQLYCVVMIVFMFILTFALLVNFYGEING